MADGAWYCQTCGVRNHPDRRACGNCGSRRAGTSPAVQTAAVFGGVLLLAVVGVSAWWLGRADAPDAVAASTPSAAPVAVSSPTPPPAPSSQPPRPSPSPTSIDEPRSFSEIFEVVSSGVVRIEATTCARDRDNDGVVDTIGDGVGSGFLLSPTHVATVAHVVDGSVGIGLVTDAQLTFGRVIGIDPQRELALIEADDPIPGHVFELSPELPAIADDVAALGYPQGLPLTFTSGSVSGLERSFHSEDLSLDGLIQTDAATYGGSSGGPLIDRRGYVVGMIEGGPVMATVLGDAVAAENITLAVPAAPAVDDFERWRSAPEPQPAAQCEGYTTITTPLTVDDPDASGIATTLDRYFAGINTGNYELAWEQLSSERRAQDSFAAFRDAVSTSLDQDVAILEITAEEPDVKTAFVTFRSLQAEDFGPRPGETCSIWNLDYSMVREGGRWHIDGATARFDEASFPCPAEPAG